ncbi:transcription factor bHLH162 isoform X2 [Beta vulgaris subsp. vulgaris]|uniref:transcription factor bHLH162 isoform X2 n=1 Tax=Beta vulgaris subsp. vulgaris TaxID=3555 RepID=UPI0020374903|nr:transcription factor bHLH162 isoform X2 [Beta vulgaris subsp. vulgaris]
MNTNSSKSVSKTDRKTIEKNRRNHMKGLYSQLNSLVHHDVSSSRDSLPLPDQIDEATKYIKKLEENVMNLKEKKDSLVGVDGKYSNIRGYSLNSPVQIEVHEKGSAVEVILVTGLECQFVFTEAMRIVHEEHAEVVNASYSVVGTTVFHSIHAKGGRNKPWSCKDY